MKILYATDGFEPALNAGALIAKIGNKDELEITVMSVTHAGRPSPEHLLLMLDPLTARREDSVRIVDAATEKLRDSGFKANAHTAEGHPGEEIVRAVERDWYDLIVMGAGGRTWLGSKLLGSVSTYVLHSSPSSVLIVHDGPIEREHGRALIATDGSHGAQVAADTFARFADTRGVDVSVVSVVPDQSPWFFAVPGAAYIPPQAYKQDEQVTARMRDRARRHAESCATQMRDAGFEAEAHVAAGDPTEQLLKESEGGQFDLVVLGSRGLGPFRRALMGSVSEHVTRHSRATLVGRRLVS